MLMKTFSPRAFGFDNFLVQKTDYRLIMAKFQKSAPNSSNPKKNHFHKKVKQSITKGKGQPRVRKPKEVLEEFDEDGGEGDGENDNSTPQPAQAHVDFNPTDDNDGNNWKKKKKSGGFQSMGLSQPILKGILRRGYKVPTPIQRKTIPAILEGKDVVAMARTGSGKTAAFLIPLFEKLCNSRIIIGESTKFPRAIILSPTRELATQTVKFFREIGKYTTLKVVAILGGDSMESQFEALHNRPDVVVATPGRFMHLCVEMEYKLDGVEYIVFDEADRLFEMGFGEQLSEILKRLPENRQTVLFSATLPKILVDFTKAGLHDPTLIRLDVDTKLPDRLKLTYLGCRSEDKIPSLLYLLKNEIDDRDQTMVFVATKHHVEHLHAILDEANISNCYIYSSLDASARKISLGKFRNGKANVMIVTDIAARGIDIPVLDNVINFHFPAKPKLFMHRVGRVARAGRSGTAYSLVGPDEIAALLDLHLFLAKPLKFSFDKSEDVDSEVCIVGKMPQELIDEEQGFLKNLMDVKNELFTLAKVCKNGYAQYLKSRPNPSTESNRRAKGIEIAKLPFHPIFGNRFKEDPMQSLITQMQTYRPKATIFEIGPKAGSETFQIMKIKREKDQRVVSKYRNQKAGISGGNNEVFGDCDGSSEIETENNITHHNSSMHVNKVDEENFIPYLPKDHHTESGLSVGTAFDRQVQNSIMDMTGDDSKVLGIQKSMKKWDMKKKKFVQVGEGKRKKIKTESGTWISASYKSDRYNSWKQKSKIDNREDDDNRGGGSDMDIDTDARHPSTSFNNSNPNSSRKIKGKRIRTEIKRPEQILKDRKIKEKKQNKSKPKKSRNKNSSSGGGGGGPRKGKGRK